MKFSAYTRTNASVPHMRVHWCIFRLVDDLQPTSPPRHYRTENDEKITNVMFPSERTSSSWSSEAKILLDVLFLRGALFFFGDILLLRDALFTRNVLCYPSEKCSPAQIPSPAPRCSGVLDMFLEMLSDLLLLRDVPWLREVLLENPDKSTCDEVDKLHHKLQSC